jgi:hypothetical protein
MQVVMFFPEINRVDNQANDKRMPTLGEYAILALNMAEQLEVSNQDNTRCIVQSLEQFLSLGVADCLLHRPIIAAYLELSCFLHTGILAPPHVKPDAQNMRCLNLIFHLKTYHPCTFHSFS